MTLFIKNGSRQEHVRIRLRVSSSPGKAVNNATRLVTDDLEAFARKERNENSLGIKNTKKREKHYVSLFPLEIRPPV